MSGDFRIHIEETCAGAIAGNFTGAMDPAELDSATTTGVLCELANMICGATLSRLEPDSIFKLGQPRLAQPGLSGDPDAAEQWLRMDEGLIGLQLRVEDNP
jgi:CheY-specific phosphatase CheX